MSYLSPNMSLIISVPDVDGGPDWASNISASFTILDSHNHVPGSGVPIPTSGININADLSFNNDYNLIGMRSGRFYNQSAALALAADLSCLYSAGTGGDLYYNDANGNQVRITNSGSVAGSAGTITGLPFGTAGASYVSASGTFQFLQATSTAANMDGATLIVRYPGSYPTPSGNYIAIQAPTSLASGYSLTLPSLPGQTNMMTLTSAGVISSITYDAVGQAMTSVGANAIQVTSTRATGTSVGVGGIAISTSCGAFSTSSSTPVDVTNLSVTLVTSGKPVQVMLISDGTISGNQAGSIVTSTTAVANVYALRASTIIGAVAFGSNGGATAYPAPGVMAVDAIAAGTYTYKVQLSNIASANTIMNRCILIAYELQ